MQYSKPYTSGFWQYEAHHYPMWGMNRVPPENLDIQDSRNPFGYISTQHPLPIVGFSPILGGHTAEELTANGILMSSAPAIHDALIQLVKELSDSGGEESVASKHAVAVLDSIEEQFASIPAELDKQAAKQELARQEFAERSE